MYFFKLYFLIVILPKWRQKSKFLTYSSANIDFSGTLFGETISYSVCVKILTNIFIAVLNNFCQNFTEIPKNIDFWMKLTFLLKKTNFCSRVSTKFRTKTIRNFRKLYRKTYFSDSNLFFSPSFCLSLPIVPATFWFVPGSKYHFCSRTLSSPVHCWYIMKEKILFIQLVNE